MRVAGLTVLSLLAIMSPGRSGLAQPAATGESDRARQCRVAIAAYVNHLEQFPYYSCRYVVTSANADTIEDALAGRWIDAVSARQRILVKGKKELHEVESGPLPNSTAQ